MKKSRTKFERTKFELSFRKNGILISNDYQNILCKVGTIIDTIRDMQKAGNQIFQDGAPIANI